MRLKNNKTSSGFLWKILLVVILCLLTIGIYISPLGQKVYQIGKMGWEYTLNKAEWRLGSPDDVMLVGHKRTSRETILNALQIAHISP